MLGRKIGKILFFREISVIFTLIYHIYGQKSAKEGNFAKNYY